MTKYKIINEKEFQCVECNFISDKQRSVSSHWWRKHTEHGRLHKSHGPGALSGTIRKVTPAWNKGLSKKTDERIRQLGYTISKNQKEAFKNGTRKPTKMSEENKIKLSERQSLNNSGGKTKWFEVAGQKIQGTWERNIAIKFEELKIKWFKPKTNNDIWKYAWEGKIKSYSPDFYLPDYDLWLEIKGYWWGRDKEKMEIVKKTYPERKLIIIEEKDYKKILEGELVW